MGLTSKNKMKTAVICLIFVCVWLISEAIPLQPRVKRGIIGKIGARRDQKTDDRDNAAESKAIAMANKLTGGRAYPKEEGKEGQEEAPKEGKKHGIKGKIGKLGKHKEDGAGGKPKKG